MVWYQLMEQSHYNWCFFVQKMRKSSQNRHSLSGFNKSKQKLYSLHHLEALKAKLEKQSIESKRIRQQMKFEKAMSSQIGFAVSNEIVKVQNDGTYFASKLEEEKRKNTALETLVRHYQHLINSQKKEQQEKLMKTIKIVRKSSRQSNIYEASKVNTENCDQGHGDSSAQCQQQIRQAKQLQSSLEQYILKNNSSQYELDKKLDQVRMLRSERTVFNKIFDQLQTEILDLEMSYKKLVIQRAVLQAEFSNNVHHFEVLNAKADDQFQKLTKNQHKTLETQRLLQTTRRDQVTALKDIYAQTFQSQQETIMQNRTVDKNTGTDRKSRWNTDCKNTQQKQTPIDANSESNVCIVQKKQNRWNNVGDQDKSSALRHSKIQSRVRRQNITDSLREKQEESNLSYEKRVKQIYEQLKIPNVKSLPRLTRNLQSYIQKLFIESESLYQKLYAKQKFIADSLASKNNSVLIIGEKHKNQSYVMQKQIHKLQNLRQNIKNTHQQRENIHKQLESFSNSQIVKIERLLNLDNKNLNQTDTQIVDDEHSLSKDQISTRMSTINDLLSDLFAACPLFHVQRNQNTSLFSEEGGRDSRKYQTPLIRNTHKSSTQSEDVLDSLYKTAHDQQQSSFKQQLFIDQCAQSDSKDLSKLEQVLKANKTTHNNISIYSEEELIKISRYNINKCKAQTECKLTYRPEMNHSEKQNNQYESRTRRQSKNNSKSRRESKDKDMRDTLNLSKRSAQLKCITGNNNNNMLA